MLLLRREHIDRLFDMLIANRRFDTPFKITEYDGGMNFLGAFGEVPVHELGNRSTTLCFEWKGEISEPRDTHDIAGMKPNILMTLTGQDGTLITLIHVTCSCGFKGLILKHIVINDEDELLRIWCNRRKIYFYRYRLLKAIPIVRNILLHKAWQEIYRINEMCRNTSFEIAICNRLM